MPQLPLVIGVAFTALAVWIGPYLVPYIGGRLYHSPETIGRILVSCATLAPFLLMSWILGTRRMRERPFARTAVRVATGILAAGLAIPYLILYYSNIEPSYGWTEITLLCSFLILSSPIWLTVLGLVASGLTSQIAQNRTERKVDPRQTSLTRS
jgi:hypothetical protein